MEHIRKEFERQNAIPSYAAWNTKSETYRWRQWPGVDCPDINDQWEAFVEGWEACLESRQLPK